VAGEKYHDGRDMENEYPKKVKACDVVNGNFAPGLFMIEGGRAKYDEVTMADGGCAVYLARVESTENGLKVTRRWIEWDTPILQMFEAEP